MIKHPTTIRFILGTPAIVRLRTWLAEAAATLSNDDAEKLRAEFERLLDKRLKNLRKKTDPCNWNPYGKLPLDPLLASEGFNIGDTPRAIEKAITRRLTKIREAALEADRRAETTSYKGAA